MSTAAQAGHGEPRVADARFMALALALARRGLGNTWPNPAVGCVIERGGRILGRGWTMPSGRPHAEVVALAQAGAAARGATAHVTLEPCAHQGRAPPCAEALIGAGIVRVSVAMTDPDPRVNGRGIARLRAAGVEVQTGAGETEARQINHGFLLRVQQGRPMLTLKLAGSLDGRIATEGGESRWITGAQARHLVHGLRLRHDAVLVGGGTARADDPLLTVRGFGPVRQPVRVVLSAGLDLNPQGRLADSLAVAPLWLLHGPQAPETKRAEWQRLGARLFELPAPAGRLELGAALQALGGAGLTRVLCEGGGQLAAALLRAGLVDELWLFTAGLALGAEGRPALGAMALQHLAEAPRLRLRGLRPVGPDVLQIWRRA